MFRRGLWRCFGIRGAWLLFFAAFLLLADEMLVLRCSGLVKASNEERLQFTPRWTKERFEDNIDGEVRDVLELGRAKSSVLASLEALGK